MTGLNIGILRSSLGHRIAERRFVICADVSRQRLPRQCDLRGRTGHDCNITGPNDDVGSQVPVIGEHSSRLGCYSKLLLGPTLLGRDVAEYACENRRDRNGENRVQPGEWWGASMPRFSIGSPKRISKESGCVNQESVRLSRYLGRCSDHLYRCTSLQQLGLSRLRKRPCEEHAAAAG